MAHANVAEAIRRTRLQNESEEYLAKREELRLAEVESMRLRERVAELRRNLPNGAAVADFEFLDCSTDPVQKVAMSKLFTGRDRPLVLYQFMYGKQTKEPCSMCTMIIDGLNGVAHHIAQNADLAIVAATTPQELREFAKRRGWDRLQLLTTPPDSTFKYDLGGEDAEGNQDATVSVFTMEPSGTIRHFYSVHPQMAPDIHERGMDLICAVYNVLDLTPKGRGDWNAELEYTRKPQG